LIGNFTKILNVVAASDVKKFPLTILIPPGEFTGRATTLDLVAKNATGVKILDVPTDFPALISSILQ
jgi:hypothetical protein